MKLKTLFALAIIGLFSASAYSNVYLVKNTAGNAWWPEEGDANSFKAALFASKNNPGRDTIRFELSGGTSVSAVMNPIPITTAHSDLLVDGYSTIDGNPIKLTFSFRVEGSNVDFKGIDFQTVNNPLEVTGNNISVDNCTFLVSGAGQNAVWIRGGNNSSITNCTFTNSKQHAVSIENGGGHTISNCSSTGSVDVAFITRGTGGNTFTNCSASDGEHNGFGMLSRDNIIEDCISFNNDRSGIAVDNSTGQSSGNIIRRNQVYGNNRVFYMGAVNPLYDQAAIFTDGPSTEIYENYIYDNEANGIMLNGALANNGVVRDNVIGRNSSGDELGNGWNGIFVHTGSNAIVEDNIVVNNGTGDSHNTYDMKDRISGIRFQNTTSGTIQNNYVGTDANKTNAGNAFDGITLYQNTTNTVVTNNVICYNGFSAPNYGDGGGLALREGSGNGVAITANYIGAHEDLSDGGNNDYGISLESANNVTVGGVDVAQKNIIANTKNASSGGNYNGRGIWLAFSGTTGAEIYNNDITNNAGPGIEVMEGASNNIIGAAGDGNTITGNELGIVVTGNSINNTMRYNSFSCNVSKGILLENGGNEEYGNNGTPKSVLVNTSDPRVGFVSGFAPSANASVDIYAKDSNCELECDDPANQGATYVTTVSASASISGNGMYSWEYDFAGGGNQVNQETVIVLATENGSAGTVNTSEFSICNLECDTPQNALITSSDLSFCEGEEVSLEANADNLSGSVSYTYAWYLGSIANDNLVTSKTNDNTYSTDVAGTYFVVVSNQQDPDACFDNSPGVTVVADVSPITSIQSSNPAGVCEGESVTLSSNATGLNLVYSWSTGASSPNIVTSEGGTYSVTVTSTSTGCDALSSFDLVENNNPILALPDSLLFCQSDSLEISAGVSGLEYLWSPTNNTSESFYIQNSGTHRLLATDPISGCEARDTVVALQSPQPKPSVTLPSDSILCESEGEQIAITANYIAFLPGELQWSDGTLNEDSILVSDTLEYWAKYIDVYGCEGVDSIKISNFCIPPEPELPNVASEDSPFTPTGDVAPEQILESSLTIYNRWGLEVFALNSSDELPVWKGYNKKDNPCSSGVYYWIWEFTDNTYTEKRYNGFVHFIR